MRPSSPSLSPGPLPVTAGTFGAVSTASPATSPSALSSGSSPPSKRSFCIEALLANNEAGVEVSAAAAGRAQGRRGLEEDADDPRQRRRYPDALYGRYAPYNHNNNLLHPKGSSSPASDLSLPRPTSVESPPASPPASPVSRSGGAPSEPRSDRSEDSMSPPISPGSEDVPESYAEVPRRDALFASPGANGFLALNRNLGLPPLAGHHALYYAGGHGGPVAAHGPGHPAGPQGHHSAFHPAGKGPGPGAAVAAMPQHQMNLQHMQLEWLSRTGMFYPRLPDLSGKSFVSQQKRRVQRCAPSSAEIRASFCRRCAIVPLAMRGE
ncbi:hypothetical protein ONE63_008718 [Megalurothrips usitatus]|uniref:Uncharacterized protein n=1 Tax=Megalurothrips usitatus TaxID=439358 RepID=A0AAV7XN42_9NEOP|nr:hypothetical protein ONE63_008718 [Megalurothrips usitatus]